MIKIENSVLLSPEQWKAIILGIRNAMNSWDKSDSEIKYENVRDSEGYLEIGSNDHALMVKLCNAGTDHRKFMRMITVYLDIAAPRYWWKEFKTYCAGRKLGDDEPGIIDEGYLEYDIEMNSCSTMYKIAAKEFTLEDFSCEHLIDSYEDHSMNINYGYQYPKAFMQDRINILNHFRVLYLKTKDKKYWWQMIQLLPSSYNQRRTVILNYEVLANIYKSCRNHKLDEWRELCIWIESLPYSELITGKVKGEINI